MEPEIIANIIIIGRGRKFQYLFERVFSLFKIMLTISYRTDLFV